MNEPKNKNILFWIILGLVVVGAAAVITILYNRSIEETVSPPINPKPVSEEKEEEVSLPEELSPGDTIEEIEEDINTIEEEGFEDIENDLDQLESELEGL